METTNQTILPQLIKGSATYKLIVPEKVEEKIRYLLRKFPSTEWSGVLFYTHEGTFEDNSLVVTCQDIYPMDLGTSGWTEFKMNEDVSAYMADNIELFDYDMGLVHSHHTLGAFFSNQDVKMIQQEGNDTNCFVSLVVDTRGQYVAIVTRKIQTKSEVTVKNLGKSYEFFGEGSKEITHNGTETTKVIEKEVIEYFDLEVERHEVPNTLDYLDDRFNEIVKKKGAVKEERFMLSPQRQVEVGKEQNFLDFLHNKEPRERDLFGENKLAITKEDKEKLDDIVEWHPDENKIRTAALHIITCNFILNPEKVDLKQWVARHMIKMYERIFGKYTYQSVELDRCCAFTEWKDFIVQWTIDYFEDATAPDELFDDGDLYTSKVAEALYNEINQYRGNDNFYIDSYLETIEQYII